MTTASEVCEFECLVTSFAFGVVDIRVIFLFTEFSLCQQMSCQFYFPHLRYFVAHEHTLGNLEVIIYFHP